MMINKPLVKADSNTGVALPIILLLLLIMTILGVTSLSTSTLQERMTASQRLREIAFNAAETTLRAGEAQAASIATTIRRDLLTTQSGASFRLFGTSDSVTPLWELGFPSATEVNPGDTCTGGYCTPAEFDTSGTANPVERWLDPDVWDDPERHRVLDNFVELGLQTQGIFEAPQYIIEFMGQVPLRDDVDDPASVTTSCTFSPSPEGPDVAAPNNRYPFCRSDNNFFFRITARAIAGTSGRESVVTLQSTIAVIPGS